MDNFTAKIWTLGFSALAIGSVIGADYFLANAFAILGKSNPLSSYLNYETLRPLLSYGHFAVGVPTVIASIFIKSPYGRHAADKKQTENSITLPAVISWMLQESPTLISFFYLNFKYDLAPFYLNPASLLFAIHYVHRVLIFPLRLGKGTPQRVWVTFLALSYCVFNGLLQNGVDPSEVSDKKRSLSSFISGLENVPLAVAGVAIFAIGMCCNMMADYHLIALKEKHNTYVIPRHFLFSKISCPNFFFEAVEWMGFTVATAGCCGVGSSKTLAAASFAFFTVCNTWMRALQHHQWYFEKFGDDYKKLNRKAVIPFIL